MAYLIKSAKVLAKHSNYHNQTVDILISKGKIKKIAKKISKADAEIISSEDLHVSVGWFDIGVHGGEPGFEQRETWESLEAVALAGGYSGIATLPNTKPIIQFKNDIKQVLAINNESTVDVFPIAALSEECNGKELSELIDLSEAGAIGFSDGLANDSSSSLLQRALEYCKSFKGKIIHHPYSNNISKNGQMNEGKNSVALGLPGIPSSIEKSQVEQVLDLVRYTAGNIILHGLSSAAAIESSRTGSIAKQVSITVPYLNLVSSDDQVLDFDENYKVIPPLRTNEEKDKLISQCKSKAVDAIISNHAPIEQEEKKDAFPLSAFGASGLQTCFSALNGIPRSKLPLENLIEKITSGPRNILDIALPKIEVGETANLSIFDPGIHWQLNETTNQSKSTNNPFFGQQLEGKVICVINKNKVFFNQY